MLKSIQSSSENLISASQGAVFNLVAALPGRVGSQHTHRAYYRWVDQYLVDIAGLQPTQGEQRLARMQRLPVPLLRSHLSPARLRAWLGMLVQRNHGKQGLNQARAAVMTLTGLLAEAEWIDDYTNAAMSRVRIPRAEDGQRPGQWLSVEQLRRLMVSSRAIATSENQSLRNRVVTTLLCTMALRREELASARWDDLSVQNERVVLRVHGKGRRVATIDVPRAVVNALTQWRNALIATNTLGTANSPITRRLWKGGRISRSGLTPDGIWMIVGQAALHAQLPHVAPHDLRRSVAGALNDSGVPIEKISRLLRHKNVAITERYLSKLPQRNEGAVLMSGVLGLEDDDSFADLNS
ncbi:MAG: site-specific integrase [Anaerolineae bacterium]|nr:site-specific integrase [Anaerolineae bacterium]NUQ03229.1 tyrosine-type recombinase/integrase [Anaerolineae bacterium]